MNKLPYDVIYYIKNLLDPVTFISFLETGSNIVNNKNRKINEKRQYLNKKIEYFKHRGIDIDENTVFLSLSNQEKFKITNPGNYICIKESQKLTRINICGDNIHINLNKKTIKCALNKNITISGSNISIYNGSFIGYNTNIISLNRFGYIRINKINVKLFKSKKERNFCIYGQNGSNALISNSCFSTETIDFVDLIFNKKTEPVLPKKKYYKFNDSKKFNGSKKFNESKKLNKPKKFKF